jgi:Cu2+-exporting ATPase
MVQVVAARALFEHGIMVKDGSAMERLVEIDTILFDKTGTLTLGRPGVRRDLPVDEAHLAVAARIGAKSHHPYAQALAAAAVPADIVFDHVEERAGLGLEARSGADIWRLGRGRWALDGGDRPAADGTVLARNGQLVQAFAFEDELRPGAAAAVAALRRSGFALEIMSGDTSDAVEQVAAGLGITTVRAGLLPADKTAHLDALARNGHKALMVGDGLNDAPALAAAHVSIAPGSAADVGRQAADFVFLRPDLESVPFTIGVARAADRLIRQNFAFAALYNMVALPIAIAGYVTPLIAALAMSGSSILVVANALRLGLGSARRPRTAGTA